MKQYTPFDLTGIATGTPPLQITSTTQVNNLTAQYAGNIAGGAAGGIPYQTGSGATSILAAGVSNQVLVSGGSSAPVWTNQSALSVGMATNLNGGTAGALHYQSSSGVSAFLSIGAANTVLTSSGSLPQWSTSLALTGTIQANISGGLIEQKSTFTPTTVGWYRIIQSTTSSSGRIIIRGSYGGTFADVDFLFNVNGFGGAGTLTQLLLPEYYSGGALVTQARISSDGGANIYLDIYVASVTSAGPISVYAYGPECFGVVSSPVVGAVAGSSSVSTITFQKGVVTTQAMVAASFSGAGTGLTGTASSLSIGGNAATATTSTNIAGGAAGSLPYQSGSGTTALLSLGTSSYVLTAGASAPQWTNSDTFVDDTTLDGIAALGSTIKSESIWCPLFQCNTAVSLSSQQVRFVAVYLNKAQTLTGVVCYLKTTGSYTGNNFNGVGLYSYGGGTLTRVASSSSSLSLWGGATGFLQISFSSTYAAAKGLYFIALMYSSSAQTTAPALAGMATLDAANKVTPLTTNSSKIQAVSTNVQTTVNTSYSSATELSTTTSPVWAALY